jgi:hypothetical protein
MEYIIISDRQVCGKVKDEKLTKDDILSAGGSVEHLLVSGHIKAANATNATNAAKVTPAVKEVPQATQQEPEVSVFNSVNNEQGDK